MKLRPKMNKESITPPEDILSPELETFITFCRAQGIPEGLMLGVIATCSDKQLAAIIVWAVEVYQKTGKKPSKLQIHEKLMSTALEARAQKKWQQSASAPEIHHSSATPEEQ